MSNLTHRSVCSAAWMSLLLGPLPVSCAQTSPTADLVAAVPPNPSLVSAASMGEIKTSMHLTVGRIAFLNAVNRVHRIYISDPAVVEAHTISPKQIVLTAKTPGFSSVVLWDEEDRQQTYSVFSDLDADGLSDAIHNALPGETINMEASGSRVILTGTVSTAASSDQAYKLASVFSKDVLNSLVINPARIKQVKLDVRIVEIDRSRINQFGVNLFNPGGSTTIASSTTAQFPTTATLTAGSGGSGSTVGNNTLNLSSALNFLFYSSKINVGAVVQDLENKQVLQILAEPTITTLSGQKASFLAGGEFPFPVVQGSSGGLTSITVQFRPYGVKLEFTPEVGADGNIALKIAPEVSTLDYTNAVVISGYTIPALSTKHAETQVVVKSGQSFAISGLLDKRTTDTLSRTPGIASVPILGNLFKSKGINLSTTELIVIVTPTVIDPLSTLLPSEPAPAIPFLDKGRFDSSLPAAIENR